MGEITILVLSVAVLMLMLDDFNLRQRNEAWRVECHRLREEHALLQGHLATAESERDELLRQKQKATQQLTGNPEAQQNVPKRPLSASEIRRLVDRENARIQAEQDKAAG